MTSKSETTPVSGTVDFTVGGKKYKTWYEAVGQFDDPETIPIVVVHGGPAIPSIYLRKPHQELYGMTGQPVIAYDQIGCGNSSRPKVDKNNIGEFFTEELFHKELRNILSQLGLLNTGRKFDLLGHSWGGMFGSKFVAVSDDISANLRSLALISAPSSAQRLQENNNRLLNLPDDDHKKIKEGLEGPDADDDKWMFMFYRLHLLKKPYDEWPDEMKAAFDTEKNMNFDIYNAMWGPSEFKLEGNLKDWVMTEALIKKIKVPTLIINGECDEVGDECVADFVKYIPAQLRRRIPPIVGASHMPFWEKKKEYLKEVADFYKSLNGSAS